MNHFITLPVFYNPRPSQDVVEVKRLNDFSAYFRNTDTYKELCSEEGFELNFANFEWEYIIKSKNNHSFIVLNESLDNGLLGVFAYFQGKEIKGRPDFYFNPALSNIDITQYLQKLFVSFVENDPNKVSKNPNHNRPTTKGSNHTPPKKKRQ